jgi:hypothetical protein
LVTGRPAWRMLARFCRWAVLGRNDGHISKNLRKSPEKARKSIFNKIFYRRKFNGRKKRSKDLVLDHKSIPTNFVLDKNLTYIEASINSFFFDKNAT